MTPERATMSRMAAGARARDVAASPLAFALVVAACSSSGGASTDGGARRARGPVDAAEGRDGDSRDAPGDGLSPEAGPAGVPAASLSAASIDFGDAVCGQAPLIRTLTVTNDGAGRLVVAAAVAGSPFAVTPDALSLDPHTHGVLTLTGSASTTTPAADQVAGALELFTNDPSMTSPQVALTVTSRGATLALARGTGISFPNTEVGATSKPVSLVLENSGNASASFALGTPTDTRFALSTAGGPPTFTLGAGAKWTGAVRFSPTDTSLVTATINVTTTGTTCGQSLESIPLSGRGAGGEVTGWPTSTIDFGPAPCGGEAPAEQTFLLTNTGSSTAYLTVASITGAPGFTTSAEVGRAIAPYGGGLGIHVFAPPIPSPCPVGSVTATLTLETNDDLYPHMLPLSEEPASP